MSDELEDFGLVERQRSIQAKLGKLSGYREWYQTTFGKPPERGDDDGLQPFKLKGATANQEQALRALAREYGFKDMRGFNKFMESAHVDYYDLIKVASP